MYNYFDSMGLYEETDMKDYIKWLRSKVGHEMIILNFSGAIIRDEKKRVLLQRRTDTNKWGFPGGALEECYPVARGKMLCYNIKWNFEELT